LLLWINIKKLSSECWRAWTIIEFDFYFYGLLVWGMNLGEVILRMGRVVDVAVKLIKTSF